MKRRVVVTGMGAVSPIGNDVKTLWENVQKGICGISPIDAFDASQYTVSLAAQV
ncbi:MAG TPA: beta-ketoacyl-[acyl-carrier-protein] synthase II, partial [Erysipelotrichaceae bacterium]|nr:beta-ketoacyl-[acyl-carrier-protein] synthase II [Erysipelotrichaceae bacterium]